MHELSMPEGGTDLNVFFSFPSKISGGVVCTVGEGTSVYTQQETL